MMAIGKQAPALPETSSRKQVPERSAEFLHAMGSWGKTELPAILYSIILKKYVTLPGPLKEANGKQSGGILQFLVTENLAGHTIVKENVAHSLRTRT
jgi:hypothetical protein